ncbi:MAG: hypothetical protein JXQ77_01145, partial [Campylobacterales bacterium]|nr:hypothetical protein [Campylobacterales bacterium]
MNKISKIVFALIALIGIGAGWYFYQNKSSDGEEKNLAVVYTVEGNGETKFDDLMDNKLSDIDFTVTDPHKRINDSYKKHFDSTKLDLISFMPTVNVEKMKALFTKEPRLALYSPFNMLAFKKTGENKTQLMHLTPEAILDIAGITDEGVKAEFTAMFKPLDERIEKVFGGKKSYITYNTLDNDRIMNFEVTFKRPEKISDFVEQFQEKFEEKFEENK